jgi:hypothetical protein
MHGKGKIDWRGTAWQGNDVTLGLPKPALGFSIEDIAKTLSVETGLLYRAELINYIKSTAKGDISEKTGVKVDGRVVVIYCHLCLRINPANVAGLFQVPMPTL